MDRRSNSFENLVQSFKSVCSTLENNAEYDLMDIEKEYKKEFLESAKTLQKFNELTTGIGDTCQEILNCGDALNLLAERSNPESAIHIPFEIHSDLVNSINALYNMAPLGKAESSEKLISERNKQLVSDIIKEYEKNVHDMKELKIAVTGAKLTLES